MSALACYVPKPQELESSIWLIAFAFVVLCVCAYWLRISLPIAIVLIAGGGAVAVIPDLVAAAGENLGPYGDMARMNSHTDHSDAFFAITYYFHVGRGQLMAFLGMSLALLGHAGFAALRNGIRRRRPRPAPVASGPNR